MSSFLGRRLVLNWGATSPAALLNGVREKGVTLNGEPIDISDSGSEGWRELLNEPGERSVNISLSGITKDTVLKEAWFDDDRTGPASLTYPDGGIIEGEFYLASYSETGPYKDATTFEAELQSTGEVFYTPPA